MADQTCSGNWLASIKADLKIFTLKIPDEKKSHFLAEIVCFNSRNTQFFSLLVIATLFPLLGLGFYASRGGLPFPGHGYAALMILIAGMIFFMAAYFFAARLPLFQGQVVITLYCFVFLVWAVIFTLATRTMAMPICAYSISVIGLAVGVLLTNRQALFLYTVPYGLFMILFITFLSQDGFLIIDALNVTLILLLSAAVSRLLYYYRLKVFIDRETVESRLNAAMETMDDAVMVIDLQGLILDINNAGVAMSGNGMKQEVVGEPLAGLVIQEEREQFFSTVSEVVAGKPVRNREFTLDNRSGVLRPALLSMSLITDAGGELWNIVVVVRDMTDERKLASAIRESEIRLQTILHNIPEYIFVYQDNRPVFLSHSITEKLGYSAEELSSFNIFDLIVTDEDRSKALENMQRRFRGDIIEDYFITVRDSKNMHHEVLVKGDLIEFDGAPAILLVLIDLTEHKTMERQLLEKTHQQRIILESVPVGIAYTKNREFLWVNNAMCIMFGRSQREWIGQGTEIVFPDELHYKRFGNEAYSWLENHATYTGLWQQKRFDGSVFWVQITGTRIDDDSGEPAALWIIDNVSEQKRAYDMVKESEARLQALTQMAPDGIIMIDDRDTIVLWNASAEKIFGYSHDEALGQKLHDLIVPERYRSDAAEGMKQFILNGTGPAIGKTVELYGLRRDGTEFPVGLSLSALKYHDRWHAIGILRDITDRKAFEHELEKARERAESANQAKSQFLANMSHEIRTPMNAVLGFADLLKETSLDEKQWSYVSTISESGELLVNLINDILDISQIEAGKVELESIDFDMEKLVQGLLKIVSSRALPKSLDLRYSFSADTPRCYKGDPTRIKQILLNLLNNAVKFTDRGEVVVSVSCLGSSVDEAVSMVELSVKDTGIGIDETKQEMIFMPFAQEDSSTTRRYGGTGLGLYICKKLTSLMNGGMRLISRKGEGSEFIALIELEPIDCFQTPVGNDRQLTHGEPLSLKGCRVLVVEDNAVNIKLITALLEKMECSTAVAHNGREAINKVESSEWDILLMDLQMPVMGGVEATRIIRNELRIGTPIIALTAAAMKDDEERARAAGMNDFITKPVKLSILKDVLLRWFSNKSDAKDSNL